jgi:hypothetical protein
MILCTGDGVSSRYSMILCIICGSIEFWSMTLFVGNSLTRSSYADGRLVALIQRQYVIKYVDLIVWID